MDEDEPTIFLICCEGKTEELYFKLIARIFDLSNRIKVYGQVGELTSVVDFCVDKCSELSHELEIPISEIEMWVVCDDDNRNITYAELLKYAKTRNVNLAYSKPQFEAFLVQHFEQSSEYRRTEIFKKIHKYISNYNKGSIGDFDEILFRKPKIIDVAIENSNIRRRKKDRVFFTIHKLVKRIKKISSQ